MDRSRLVLGILATTVYWMVIALLLLAPMACIEGDPQFRCPSAAEQQQSTLLILFAALVVYAIGCWFLSRRHARRGSRRPLRAIAGRRPIPPLPPAR